MSFSGSRGASKASASTTCQKCLQKGHYSYECKAAVQERPYAARPSRSAQLFNPRLKPALTNHSLQEPDNLANKKGLAAAILEEKAQERRRKRRTSDGEDDNVQPRKRNRSESVSSVSTISTNRSRSRSVEAARAGAQRTLDDSRRSSGTKRARDPSGPSEDGMYGIEGQSRHVDEERNTRHRVRSVSPQERGRGMSRKSGSGRSRSRSRSRGGARDYGGENYNGSQVGPPPGRQRSSSPFSKRMAMSRGTGK